MIKPRVENMKKTWIVLIVALLTHVAFLMIGNYSLSHSSDFQIIIHGILWCGWSILSIIQLRKAIKANDSNTIIESIGYFVLCLIAAIPISMTSFFIFLSITRDGVDFK